MPKRVDHQERRRQIADALLRVAAARGLHATGMREVAAEAGVSLRLVQYYFGTKEELLLFATQQLAARFSERSVARISALKETGSPVRPRDVIAAILAEALPADEEMRTFYVVYTAYLALSLTDPALAIAPLVKNSGAVTGVIAAQLRAARDAGDTPARLDPDLEAFGLTALSAGLATSVLAGQSSAGQAQAVIDYHLNRLFPAPGPALRATRRPAALYPSDAGITSGLRRPGPAGCSLIRHKVKCLACSRCGSPLASSTAVALASRCRSSSACTPGIRASSRCRSGWPAASPLSTPHYVAEAGPAPRSPVNWSGAGSSSRCSTDSTRSAIPCAVTDFCNCGGIDSGVADIWLEQPGVLKVLVTDA